MEQFINLIQVKNPFKPSNSKVQKKVQWDANKTVKDYVAEHYDLTKDFELAVSVNGEVITNDSFCSRVLKPSDCLVFCNTIHGGGGGGGGGSKNTAGTVAMLAVMVVAIAAATYTGGASFSLFAANYGWASAGTMSSMLGGFVGLGVMAAGSMLVNSVLPAATPTAKALESFGGGTAGFEDSQTYSWNAEENPTVGGKCAPVIYGTHRIIPGYCSTFVETDGDEQYLNMLFVLADHEIDEVDDIQINSNPISNFEDIDTNIRYGTNDQSIIPYFNDTYYETLVGRKLSSDSYATVSLQGDETQALGIGIVFSSGLYWLTTDGSFEEINQEIIAEYKKTSDSTWSTFSGGYGNQFIYTDLGNPWTGGGASSIAAGYYLNYNNGSGAEVVKITDVDTSTRTITIEYPKVGYTINVGTYINVRTYVEGEDAASWPIVGYIQVESIPTELTVTGKTGSAVRRYWRQNGLEAGEYEIRLKLDGNPYRTSSPSFDVSAYPTRYKSDCYFEYAQTMVPDDFTYPGTALLGLRALATDQLNGSKPTISCLVSRNTVNVHDGSSWVEKSAQNPAWICYDILVNDTYGGAVDYSRMDYTRFLEWANWCDTKGITCNFVFESNMSVAKALSHVSQIGRAIVVQRGTDFSVVVDKPSSPVAMFTIGNIAKDSFKETFLKYDDRANCIEVTYYDEDKDYQSTTIEVRTSDYDDTDTEVRKTSITLYGCTSKEIAFKHAKYLLNVNKYLLRTVEFTADVDAIACEVGDVVYLQHDIPQWGYGGRVVEATSSTITVDRDVVREPGESYQLIVRHADDSMETVDIASVAETTTGAILALSDTFTAIPSAGDLYSFGEVESVVKEFRIVSIAAASDQRRKLVGVEYYPEIYADSGELPEDEVVSELLAVRGLTAKETWELQKDGSGKSVVSLSWYGSAIFWNVWYRLNSETQWRKLGTTQVPEYTVRNLTIGQTYEFAISPFDDPKDSESISITILGKNAPPSDVDDFIATYDGSDIRFNWTHIEDADLWGYEIRIAPSGMSTESWDYSTKIVDITTENRAKWKPSASGSYTFLIKAYDESGNPSVNASDYDLNIDISKNIYVVNSGSETTDGYLGTYQNFVIDDYGYLSMFTGDGDDEIGTFTDDDITSYTDSYGLSGYYQSTVKDNGKIADFTLRLSNDYETIFENVYDSSIADRTDNIFPNSTDDAIVGYAEVATYYSISDDSSTWSDWKKYTEPSTVNGRYFKFISNVYVQDNNQYFRFNSMNYIADVTPLNIHLADETISSGGTTFTFGSGDLEDINIFNNFHVSVTASSPNFATPKVTKSGTSAFTVMLYENSSTPVSGVADIYVWGY